MLCIYDAVHFTYHVSLRIFSHHFPLDDDIEFLILGLGEELNRNTGRQRVLKELVEVLGLPKRLTCSLQEL